MSNYSINGSDIYTTYKVLPSPFNGNSVAVKGILDIPRRKGETEHNWGTTVEAFTSADDIEFEGRNIIFQGLVIADDRATVLSRLDAFKAAVSSGSFIFGTPFGNFTVYQKDDMTVKDHLSSNILEITLPLWQEDVVFSGSLGVASGGSGYLIDSFNLYADFSVVVQNVSDRLSMPSRIEAKTTDFFQNTQYRNPLNVRLQCMMAGDDYADLTSKMNALHKLLTSEGVRTLTYSDGGTLNCYLRDGLRVNAIQRMSGVAADFYFTMRQVM